MLRFLITWTLLLLVSSASAQEQITTKILALGDSYTIGQSVNENKRWPVQLVQALEKQQINTRVKIIAETGWTTTELEQAIAASQLNLPYDVVTLLIGVNDQFRGGSLDDYKQNFKRLLQASITYAGSNSQKVIVLSIPDYGVTPFAQRFNPKAISQEIEAFNKINETISIKAGVHYVDITPISKKAQYNESLLTSDGLHPSAIMYQQWVEELMPVVKGIVQAK